MEWIRFYKKNLDRIYRIIRICQVTFRQKVT
jgi:hypothetical protein